MKITIKLNKIQLNKVRQIFLQAKIKFASIVIDSATKISREQIRNKIKIKDLHNSSGQLESSKVQINGVEDAAIPRLAKRAGNASE